MTFLLMALPMPLTFNDVILKLAMVILLPLRREDEEMLERKAGNNRYHQAEMGIENAM